MDYNWLENVPSSVTPVPVYQPDFSFLQSMQMKANMQYEQGYSQVKNTYASVFNKPVTGEAMTKRQQEYAKQAQQQMKAISAADLSDPKNVQAAENIMTPFYKDPLLVKNISYTAWYQDQLDKQSSMKNSTDKEVRALYNPLVDSYLNNGVEQLGSAPLTNEAYSKLEKRESIPVYDIDADAKKEFAELYGKDGIKTTDLNGALMTITTNGPKSFEAYKSYYLSVASRDKYAAQNRVLATAKMENDFKDIKQRFPTMNDEQIKAEFGKEAVDGTIKYYNQAISSYTKTANDWRAKNAVLIPVDKDGKPLEPNKLIPPATAMQIKYNNDMAEQFDKLASGTTGEFTKKFGYDPITKQVDFNSDTYKKAVSDVSTNPRDYVAQIYMNHAADRWATGIAGVSSVEMKENPVWAGLNKAENERWDRMYKDRVLQSTMGYKEDMLDLKTLETYKKLGIPIPQSLLDEAGITGFTNTGAAIVGGTGTGTSKKPIAPSFGSGNVATTGVDISKVPNLLNSFQEDQQTIINSINSTAFANNGFLEVTSMVPNGLSKADVAYLSNDLQNALGSTKGYSKDAATQKRLDDLDKILTDNGVNMYNWQWKKGEHASPNQYREGLMELAHKQSQAIFQSPDAEKARYGLALAQQYHQMNDMVVSYNKNEKQYKDAIDNLIKTDKNGTFKKLVNKDANRLYNLDDIAQDLPGSITMVDPDGKEVTLNREQLARNWEKGVGPRSLAGIKLINGKPVNHIFTGKANTQGELLTEYITENGSHHTLTELENYMKQKYGTPEEREQLMRKAGTLVVGSMDKYKSGISAASIDYDLSDKENPTQRATGEEVLREGLIPTNEGTYAMYTTGADGKMSDQLTPDLQAVMHNAKYRDGFEGLVTGVRLTQVGPNGVPAMEVSFSPDKGSKDELKDVTKLREKKSIWIDISPNAKGSMLQQLPKAQMTFNYGNLLYDQKGISSSDTEEAMGFKYKIIPSATGPDGRNTMATVVSQHWSINPDGTIKMKPDGTPEWTQEVSTNFNLLQGDHALSPDELMEKVKSWQFSILGKKQQLIQMANQATPANGADQQGWVTAGSLYK